CGTCMESLPVESNPHWDLEPRTGAVSSSSSFSSSSSETPRDEEEDRFMESFDVFLTRIGTMNPNCAAKAPPSPGGEGRGEGGLFPFGSWKASPIAKGSLTGTMNPAAPMLPPKAPLPHLRPPRICGGSWKALSAPPQVLRRISGSRGFDRGVGSVLAPGDRQRENERGAFSRSVALDAERAA